MVLEPHKLWTQDEIELLKSTIIEGKMWIEIAETIGRSRHAVRNKYSRLTELTDMPPRPRGRKSPIREEEIQQIRDMTRLGYSGRKIRRLLHRGDRTVLPIMRDERNVQRRTAEPLQPSPPALIRSQLQNK